jgi:hypothetical protein
MNTPGWQYMVIFAVLALPFFAWLYNLYRKTRDEREQSELNEWPYEYLGRENGNGN